MIQLDSLLTGNSMALWILIAAVILVFSVHIYLRGLIVKAVRVVPLPAIRSAVARTAKPIVDYRHSNIKQ